MMNQDELRFQRSATRAFILADVELIQLVPTRRTDNGSGGFTTTSALPVAPQEFRLIPVTNFTKERSTLDGVSVVPNFILLGEWNCSMKRHDRFTLNGKRYEVVHVQEKRQYETKGETILLGDA